MIATVDTCPSVTVADWDCAYGNDVGDWGCNVYMPGASATKKRPSSPERTSATRVPFAFRIAIVAAYGRSGQGLSMRCTGHVGPSVTMPAIPEPGAPGGVSVGVSVAGAPST